MSADLIRSQQTGHQHFVTFGCWHRRQHLGPAAAREVFERSLDTMRLRYQFLISGYVVMPEHVHLLLTEPERGTLAGVIQAIKLSVTRKREQRPFWQARYYDWVVYSEAKRIEKLRYIHRNPVRRGLVERPEDWAWSSFRHYQTGVVGAVEIESWWTRQRCGPGE